MYPTVLLPEVVRTAKTSVGTADPNFKGRLSITTRVCKDEIVVIGSKTEVYDTTPILKSIILNPDRD